MVRERQRGHCTQRMAGARARRGPCRENSGSGETRFPCPSASENELGLEHPWSLEWLLGKSEEAEEGSPDNPTIVRIPRLIYRFSATSVIILSKLLCGYEQTNSVICKERHRPRIAHSFLKKNKAEELHDNFKTCIKMQKPIPCGTGERKDKYRWKSIAQK